MSAGRLEIQYLTGSFSPSGPLGDQPPRCDITVRGGFGAAAGEADTQEHEAGGHGSFRALAPGHRDRTAAYCSRGMFAQADRSGPVAGQRTRPEPAVRRLIRHGRLGKGSHLALDLQRIGQTSGFQAMAEVGVRPVAGVRDRAPQAAVRP